MLIFLTFSCDDFLEQYPMDGLVLEEYWQNKEDLYSVLDGAYAAFSELDSRLFLNGEMRGDMLVAGANVSNYQKGVIELIMESNILASNAFCDWADFYKVINYCNYIIKYAPIIKERDNTFSEYYMQAAIAEATALRSLIYFYLVRIYKDVPYVTWATESDAVDLFPAKTDGDTILYSIIDDLVTSSMIEKIPDYYGSIDETKGRFTRYAAYALIADIALWQYDYDLAIEYIEKIEESPDYFLVSNNDWYNLFAQGNLYESLFELQMSTSGSNPNRLFGLTVNTTLQYFKASEYAEDLFLGTSSGSQNESLEKTRKEGTLLKDDFGGYKVYKYIGTKSSGKSNVGYLRSDDYGDANFIIYRYADIMLMKAEALTQKAVPEYEEALELINTIRVRANVLPIDLDDFSSSQKEAEEYILEERALELAYEGKRWFDLLRYARRNDYANKDEFISLILENVSPSQRLIMASRLKNVEGWYLPIYQDEIDNNPNLTQNPYYVTVN